MAFKNKEALYSRMTELANINKTSKKPINESRSLSTLVDYRRADNGVAYGIIKENHHYYIKKGGLNENLTVNDFAYIGGVENIKEYQYDKHSTADKQLTMILNTINESQKYRLNESSSKLTMDEDKVSDNIEQAEDKLNDLEASTNDAPAEEIPDAPVDDVPAEDTPDVPVDDVPAEHGEDFDIDKIEVPAEDGEDGTDTPAEDGEDGTDTPAEDGETDQNVEDLDTKEIEKSLGKITNTIRKTDLEPSEIKSFINTFISAFKDKLPDVEIEDRKDMANKLIKVVGQEELDDLEDSMPSDKVDETTEDGEGEDTDNAIVNGGEGEITSDFAKHAIGMGHDAESIGSADDEELTNVISSFANNYSDGENDGDFKSVAIIITPEILEKLKSDYGHDEYANELEPYANEMNESSDEDKQLKINELFGGLKHLGNKAKDSVANKYNQAKDAVANKYNQAKDSVTQAATNVKQTYYAGEKNSSLSKLEKLAADLGSQIATVNDKAVKAGQEPINVNSILTTIKNQVGSKTGNVDLNKFRTNESDEFDINEIQLPSDHIEVQPNVNENDEDDNVLDLTKIDKQEPQMTGGFDNLGGAVNKPDGASTVQVEVDANNNKVNVSMNENHKELRSYIRERLKIELGMAKESINENVKSNKIKSLDNLIKKQLSEYKK